MRVNRYILACQLACFIFARRGAATGAEAISLSALRHTADGQIEFTVTGPFGPKYVEVSNDLAGWRTVATLSEVLKRVATTAPQGARTQFYRARRAVSSSSEFDVAALEIGSASIKLGWKPPAGTTATRIFLAPEPELLAAESGRRRQVAALPDGVAEYTADHLAAAVDLFFQIEADTPQGIKRAILHTRTKGGPRAELQTRLREVHGYAPNILMITLADGPTEGLKEGWTVRRANGTNLVVRAVHRNSIPVSAPDYPLGLGGEGSTRVLADHHLFLVLAEDIGNADLLEVGGPDGLKFTLPFSDRYLETPAIQLNQVGYNPRGRKRWAYISGWMGDGGPLALSNFPAQGEVLAEPEESSAPRTLVLGGLPLKIRKTMDVMAGTEVREMDLAALPAHENRRYRIRLPGVGVSWPTMVSEKAAFKAFYVVLRGLYHNRWGGDLRPDLTEWSRPSDHPFVYTAESREWGGKPNGDFPFQEDTPLAGRRSLKGGYHDAGDFDIRPFHTQVPQMIMRAYELAPEAFPDGQLHLPESGNGIPDLLDEALWGVAGWEQLQEDDGGVRMGVESWRHPANQGILAHLDDLNYWTYSRDENHTARCAGLFAQAARLVRPFDHAKSEELRERAVRGWNYATNHNARIGLRLYAAGELYRLSGDPGWAAMFESIWHSFGQEDWEVFNGLISVRAMDTGDIMTTSRADIDHMLAYFGSFAPGAERAAFARDRVRLYGLEAARFSENEDGDAFRTSRPLGYSLGWGQALAQGRALQAAYGALQISSLTPGERQEIFDGLSLAADYVLGGNPLGMVFFTGLGTRRVEEPLHLDSLAFIKMGRGPIPGIPVYGPTGEYDGVGYVASTMAAFYPAVGPEGDEPRDRPAASGHPFFRRYADVRLWVRANEFSVEEMQGPHAELFAALMLGTRGTLPPVSFRPGGTGHRDPLP